MTTRDKVLLVGGIALFLCGVLLITLAGSAGWGAFLAAGGIAFTMRIVRLRLRSWLRA